MKRNIDLTDNRDFRDDRISRNNISKHMVKQINHIFGKLPWQFSDSILFMSDDADVHMMNMYVLPLGDGNDRENTRLLKEEESGDYCACCGREIRVMPYNKHTDRLCDKCRKSLNENHQNPDDRIPWIITIESRRNELERFF